MSDALRVFHNAPGAALAFSMKYDGGFSCKGRERERGHADIQPTWDF